MKLIVSQSGLFRNISYIDLFPYSRAECPRCQRTLHAPYKLKINEPRDPILYEQLFILISLNTASLECL